MEDPVDELKHILMSTLVSRLARNAIEAAIKEIMELRAWRRSLNRLG
jgi:hypothetical protein